MVEQAHQVIPELLSWTRCEIERVARLAYKTTAEELDEKITPISRHCRNVHSKMAFFLDNGLISAQQFPPCDELIRQATHSFLMVVENGIRYVADAQYLQFVPEDKRRNLPEVMFIPAIDQRSFSRILLDKYSVANEYHHLWLEALSSLYSSLVEQE